MTDTKKMPMRLALREEGNYWNAYVAAPDTMEGAFLIGSIMMGAVTRHKEIHNTFKALMIKVMEHAIIDITGETPENWTETLAPPHEKAGHS